MLALMLLALAAALPALAATAAAGSSQHPPLGTRLDRQYTGYVSQPMTAGEARSQGWAPLMVHADPNPCNSLAGSPWAYNPKMIGAFDPAHPVILFFSTAGQISAIAVAINIDKDPDADHGWFEAMMSRGYLSNMLNLPVIDNHRFYTITVGLRESTNLCDARTTFPEVLGTAVVVLNPVNQSASLRVPLSRSEANELGYRRGSCFNGMGFHHFLDWTAQNGSMTWEANHIVPLVPMYNPVNGSINAIFFASAIVQQTGFHSNEWEPVPLPNSLMCDNLCDKDCTFAGTSSWSTM